jgi:hypothetical protein
MAARRVMALTVPVDGRSGMAFEAYPGRIPVLTILAARPALLVTLTCPRHLDAGARAVRPRSGRDGAAICD